MMMVLKKVPRIPNVTFAVVSAGFVDDPELAGGKAEMRYIGEICGIVVSTTIGLLSKVCHRGVR